jgi:predicted  nucleic acid-binding Zn-ribbon protein
MRFLKTILGFLSTRDKYEILESEIQTITQNLANRNTEHEKLEEFQTNLQKTFEDLSKKRRNRLLRFCLLPTQGRWR